jgi:nitrogen fixation NifU-like protein
MLMGMIQDASPGEAVALVGRFTAFLKGEGGEESRSLRDLTALEGVSRFPTRIRCALLPFDALTRALTDDE